MLGEEKHVDIDGKAADFAGMMKQDGGKILLDTRLSLYKRVYSAEDWDDFRNSVNAYKSFGEYIVVRK